ncbi:alpha/beta hydrolase [Paenibacillus taiwanensis]|uniref:alpha/beta hydrolase n=1 Tax=Paenibacillus taiwanensis TaxID=401638 RepID=UPI00041D454A|nr:alpha/beta hydrolase [Paenibacillus taiwanensis]
MKPRFSDEGEQDLCLWIHGWGVSADIWRTAAESFPQFEHHYVSFRHCQSAEQLINTVQLLPQIAAAGRNRRRFHVIGWSLGGMLTIDAAERWLSAWALNQDSKGNDAQQNRTTTDRTTTDRTDTDVGMLSGCSYMEDAVTPDSSRTITSESVGNMVNLELELISVILVGSTLSFIDDTGAAGWPKRIVKRMRSRLLQAPDSVLHDFKAKFWSASELGDSGLQPISGLCQHHLLAATDFSLAGLDAGLAYLLQADLHRAWMRLRNTNIPVLWLHGAEDPLCPLGAQAHAAAYQGRGNLTSRVLVSAGHAPFLTARDCWNEELYAWFQDLNVRKEGEQPESTSAFSIP